MAAVWNPPALPQRNKITRTKYKGPIPVSNWIIKNALVMGGYPGSLSEQDHADTVAAVLNKGVNTFACLQTDEELTGFRSYIDIAEELSDDIRVLRCPIPDCSVTTDEAAVRMVYDLIDNIQGGRVIYLHCWGGHGRSGTIVALFIGIVYGLSAADALKYTEVFHRCRVNARGKSPETASQIEQVTRILDESDIDALREAGAALEPAGPLPRGVVPSAQKRRKIGGVGEGIRALGGTSGLSKAGGRGRGRGGRGRRGDVGAAAAMTAASAGDGGVGGESGENGNVDVGVDADMGDDGVIVEEDEGETE